MTIIIPAVVVVAAARTHHLHKAGRNIKRGSKTFLRSTALRLKVEGGE